MLATDSTTHTPDGRAHTSTSIGLVILKARIPTPQAAYRTPAQAMDLVSAHRGTYLARGGPGAGRRGGAAPAGAAGAPHGPHLQFRPGGAIAACDCGQTGLQFRVLLPILLEPPL